jgi:hypothetical protein
VCTLLFNYCEEKYDKINPALEALNNKVIVADVQASDRTVVETASKMVIEAAGLIAGPEFR